MKLLSISPFPWKVAFSGGQIRIKNIVEAYQRMGVSVQSIGIIPSSNYYSQEGFVPVPSFAIEEIEGNPWELHDFYLGELFYKDARLFEVLFKQVREEPDIVQVEHPWLFKAALAFCRSCKRRPKLIYSSHNVEYLLKSSILSSRENISESFIQNEIEKIRDLEEFAVKNSDAVIVVTDEDNQWIKSVKTGIQTISCPNGVRDISSSEIPESFACLSESKYAIYCASGHPPNLEGLIEMFKHGLSAIKPDERLVIVGGVCDAIRDDYRFEKIANFYKRTVLIGTVEQSLLDALISRAHAIILPIVSGGGSNLKTAEALVAKKWIVATDYSLRGMEKFKNARGIFLANAPSSFCRQLRTAMSCPPLKIDHDELIQREELKWSSTLRNLSFVLQLNVEN